MATPEERKAVQVEAYKRLDEGKAVDALYTMRSGFRRIGCLDDVTDYLIKTKDSDDLTIEEAKKFIDGFFGGPLEVAQTFVAQVRATPPPGRMSLDDGQRILKRIFGEVGQVKDRLDYAALNNPEIPSFAAMECEDALKRIHLLLDDVVDLLTRRGQ